MHVASSPPRVALLAQACPPGWLARRVAEHSGQKVHSQVWEIAPQYLWQALQLLIQRWRGENKVGRVVAGGPGSKGGPPAAVPSRLQAVVWLFMHSWQVMIRDYNQADAVPEPRAALGQRPQATCVFEGASGPIYPSFWH